MSTLVLSKVGSVVGGALLGPLGAMIGGTLGALGGAVIDNMLLAGGRDTHTTGPRLDSLQVTSSTEGSAINRAYGRVRIGGQVIWATTLEEVASTSKQGGKGGGATAKTTNYTYYANFAIGICEGPGVYLNRIFADGTEIDMSKIDFRFYDGSETQEPDSLIESIEGEGLAPAYRGLCYIVFDRLELTDYGNRIPQFTFEIFRPSPNRQLETAIMGVNLIPGSTEFGYEPDVMLKQTLSSSGAVTSEDYENVHQKQGASDLSVSLDQLASALPNVKSVCLVVAWFFDDLRCGACSIRPKVETASKPTSPYNWQVAGLTRDTALLITQLSDDNGNAYPVYGGTPSDRSVIHAIGELKNRGYEVMLYPFIMGDIPKGNGLADPWGGEEQSAFPWRGRITCYPAPGMADSPDQTSAAADQVWAFLGSASVADFSISDETITYAGAEDWGYRRFVLHLATLASAAGGVASICIGSEMVGLTTVRDSATSYPFVTGLKTLAADVRTILGAAVKIGYAADWSEYHSHRPGDGSGDVIFNMDPLWSDANIDFIGIDNYFPLSDWRRGREHLDYDQERGFVTPYSLDYLQANIEGGEYYDFYYADNAARVAQTRTAISDGAHGEDWIFRQKDLKGWWSNSHHNRPGGVRDSEATGWTPQSKPIWFTELGCPALDLGSNQPNVFFDPKSSESALPYFSSGARDDVQQHCHLKATIDYWADAANNPASSLYDGAMIDMDRVHVWSWDARPFPSWPLDGATWADADNWAFGHWLSSRVGMVYMPDLMRHISDEYGFATYDFDAAYGACDGYVIDSTMSLRSAWQPLELAFGFDLIETGGIIKAVSRKAIPLCAAVDKSSLQDGNGDKVGELVTLTRAQESELARAVRITYLNANKAYNSGTVSAWANFTGATSVSESQLAIVMDEDRASAVADYLLQDVWAARETGKFALMPSLLALEPGDVIEVATDNGAREMRLTDVKDGEGRSCEASGFIDAALSVSGATLSIRAASTTGSLTRILARFMDLPLLQPDHDPNAGYVALAAKRWPGAGLVLRSATESNWQTNIEISNSAIIGETLTALDKGPLYVLDRGNSLDIEIFSGSLLSVTEDELLAGANAFAIETSAGTWEIIQAQTVELIGTNRYRLSTLLRGQLGTESAMLDTVAAGAAIVYLAQGIAQADMTLSDVGKDYYWRYGPEGETVGSDRFTTEQHAFTGRALKPYAPVHARWSIDDADNHTITWIRRTRLDGDSWDLYQVPLGEEQEAYEVDIISGGAVVRTITTSAPQASYSAAERLADLGSATAGYDVAIYQISQTLGRGDALEAEWKKNSSGS
ncbi:baseplate multidomain protein megatron [Cohaesibacter haloalkalitolerans]|uniref:baseplate multidomain protein megatron n=1 Tax=Cohaesibacter haloalkalitolerans TaxID=1162980 RepID=UPI0013C40428|nr:glycoside hydrolase/phage tail family protein [Cohaesibacter haloalkalitolerans]